VITFQIEEYADVIDELLPIIKAHYYEVTTFKDVKKLNLNHDVYKMMCEIGMLRITTARDEEGKLVGYCSWFVNKHMHYSDCLVATNDAVYLDPKNRGGMVAYKMFRYTMKDLKDRGVKIVAFHMKVQYPFRRLLKSLGAQRTEEIWEIKL
jgi:hypothetical protein